MAVVEQIIESLDDIPGKKFYSETHRLLKDRDELIITGLDQPDDREYLIRHEDEKIEHPIRLQISVEPYDENYVLPIVAEIACLDYDRLQFPLLLRKWREGDAFQPLGMRGKKKLSDYFIDQKFTLSQKENTWLLVSGEEIAWIVGQRISDRFRITDFTRRLCVLQFIK
ncbi:MAG: tRNA lysidine(34) synthetase TilS [Bacteroidota bacterium]|nr:tRNA lysidine(34) synthetase TilS [Bacteroidota bacterium]